MARRGTASATRTATGGPPPCHVIAPGLLSSAIALAPRSTWHPLTNHPNEPLAPLKAVRQWGSEAIGAQELRGLGSACEPKFPIGAQSQVRPQALKDRPEV